MDVQALAGAPRVVQAYPQKDGGFGERAYRADLVSPAVGRSGCDPSSDQATWAAGMGLVYGFYVGVFGFW